MSPFEALYGHPPRHFGVSAAVVCQSADLGAWLKERALTQDLLKQHLLRARQIMKQQADKHRSDRQFAIGDWVFLKVQPYVQSSIADRASHKLAFRFFGPFQVEAKVGEVSYKLKLPPKTLIHPVVHVSLLRQAHPPAQEADVRLPPAIAEEDAEQPPDEPFQVLQRRPYLRGATVRSQALVQWKFMPASLATWEDEAQLRAHFPRSPAWGQAVAEGGHNVTTQLATKGDAGEVGAEPGAVTAPGRPQRVRRPSTRLNPAEWVLK
jgi:hypothetical protein